MPIIKNYIFDLGAVLLDIDFNKLKNAFENIGITDFDSQYSHLSASHLFENLEMGKISNDDFLISLQKQTPQNSTLPEIQTAWNAILLDFRIKSMEFVKALSKDYRVFLLSNTNAIHVAEINQLVRKQLQSNQLDDFFEKAYYSFKVGMRKPNEDIFKYVLEDAGINPEESFFVDDAHPNITTAANMGFNTHLLLPGERVELLGLK
jgi:putative hydrolase of the HAD superfamily